MLKGDNIIAIFGVIDIYGGVKFSDFVISIYH